MFRPGKDKGIASPIPLGLAALATTTFLMGFGIIFQSPITWAPYMPQALLFGGLIEILAGMWAFAYGDAMGATAFTFLGAFYGWWAFAHMTFFGLHAASAAAIGSMGMVFLVIGAVTFYLWIASFYEFAAMNLMLLFLWVSYVLIAVASFTAVDVIGLIGGICSLISGLIGAYGSFATLYNATSLQEVVPVGEPTAVRERAEMEERERIRRIHAVDHVHEAGAHA